MVVVVGMIGKSENSCVKREKWQSLLKCTLPLLSCQFIFILLSPFCFGYVWAGGQGVNVLILTDFLSCHLGFWFPWCQSVLMLKNSNNFNCNKSLDQQQYPRNLKLLLHLQIRSSEILWSLGFLLKAVLPRYVHLVSRVGKETSNCPCSTQEFGMLTDFIHSSSWCCFVPQFKS